MSEAGKRKRHDAARFEWHLLAVARGEDQCDRIRAHASGREQERVAGRGVQPVADNEVAVIELENAAAYGTIKIELYSNIAPKMVERFKESEPDALILLNDDGRIVYATPSVNRHSGWDAGELIGQVALDFRCSTVISFSRRPSASRL